MRLDKKETEKEEFHKWKNAITVIASIFPIVFASIVGRMVFESARWKLEKGTTLDLLEQLIGSRTVGSTFTTQINLGKFNILGLVLLLIWAFSPLGSQSVLRMLDSRLERVTTDSGVAYFSTDAVSQLASDLPNTPESGEGQAISSGYMKAMFTSLFITSVASKSDPMDLWGNVKIPNLAITIIWCFSRRKSRKSSYLSLECYNLTMSNTSFYIPWNWTNPPTWGEYEQKLNGTWHGYNDTNLQTPWAMAVDRFVDPYWASTDNLTDRLGEYVLGKSYYGRPVLFENETDLHVKPSRLLFNSKFKL
ncbi:hypothetical protein FPOAC1_000060 [Fusarium poae]|uniref:hypothetical protein n=1 Tax=Fusarium poae TaxID=36050 RepID=UPI001CEB3FAD|nr:hypothetical protein FPOAC1_000060 [Fusarium poae]KAG8674097.1 hypothetical protein FPOAC1_000060 [Fusarium poae]